MKKTSSSQPIQPAWYLLFAAWLIVTIATLGSLFFSEIMGIPVCKLCWYQRVAMYPMVVVLAVGLFPFNPGVIRSAGPMAAIGWLIALFQLLVIAGIIPEGIQPCMQGIPCSDTHLSLLGFLNIPTLSFITFSVIGVLLIFTKRMGSS